MCVLLGVVTYCATSSLLACSPVKKKMEFETVIAMIGYNMNAQGNGLGQGG